MKNFTIFQQLSCGYLKKDLTGSKHSPCHSQTHRGQTLITVLPLCLVFLLHPPFIQLILTESISISSPTAVPLFFSSPIISFSPPFWMLRPSQVFSFLFVQSQQRISLSWSIIVFLLSSIYLGPSVSPLNHAKSLSPQHHPPFFQMLRRQAVIFR